ncbi:MAG: hypothetical protein GX455_01355, partial [Phycisphaerae bacterium]|nr:hypothetical protein [Phycisphaerae bacterium]
LSGYVRVQNNSGEDYENAQTRLIVGQVHLLDRIDLLAKRQYPYGSPVPVPRSSSMRSEILADGVQEEKLARQLGDAEGQVQLFFAAAAERPKEIIKEGLSEYFLYTIEGTETIENTWAKQLPSFGAADIPVESLYKYDPSRWGGQTIGFLRFANDADHKLGDTPLPDGTFRIFRDTGDKQHLAFVGSTATKYIPVNEKIELELGPAQYVKIEPKLMDTKTDNYRFNRDGNIVGWDDLQTWKVTANNTREIPIKVEFYANFPTSYWTIANSGDFGQYEKEDMDTAKYTLSIGSRSKVEFQYVLTLFQGTRQEDWKP